MRRLLRDLGPLELRQRGGVLAVFAPEHPEELAVRARDILGIALMHPAVVVEKTPEAASRVAVDLLRGQSGTFAIRARRRDKGFPLTRRRSPSLVGQAVAGRARPRPSTSRAPDHEIHLEVDRDEIFAFTEKIPAAAACPSAPAAARSCCSPAGSTRPVAAYRMMKRGLRCDFVHFCGRPFTGPESIYKSYAQARSSTASRAARACSSSPSGRRSGRLAAAGAGRLQVMAQRRLMVRVAAELARRERRRGARDRRLARPGREPDAAQHRASSTRRATCPAAPAASGWDKAEIMREAEEIGTYEVSTLPAEDCCTLFASPLAETRGAPEKVARLEARVDCGPGRRRAAGRGGVRAAPGGQPGRGPMRRITCFWAGFTIELHREYPEVDSWVPTIQRTKMSVRRPPFAHAPGVAGRRGCRGRGRVALIASAASLATSSAPPGWRRGPRPHLFHDRLRARRGGDELAGRGRARLPHRRGRASVAVRQTSIDLLERDGTRQTIALNGQTLIAGVGRLFSPGSVIRGSRVVAFRDGNGAAQQIRPSNWTRVIGRTLMGGGLVRAEVLNYQAKTLHDFMTRAASWASSRRRSRWPSATEAGRRSP